MIVQGKCAPCSAVAVAVAVGIVFCAIPGSGRLGLFETKPASNSIQQKGRLHSLQLQLECTEQQV